MAEEPEMREENGFLYGVARGFYRKLQRYFDSEIKGERPKNTYE